MTVERGDLALLPLIQRGAGDAEQRRLLGDRQLPRLGEAKEGAQRGRRGTRRRHVDGRNIGLEKSAHRIPAAPARARAECSSLADEKQYFVHPWTMGSAPAA